MKKKRRKRRRRRSDSGKPYQRLVAYVVQAMDPSSIVEEGKWVVGPDGKRDMDVVVRGSLDGREFSVLIECKDYDKSKTGKVGIGYVDTIDSKRKDLSVDVAMICSNSGFTSPAIHKAKRKGIGLVSVLKEGDPRIKVEILEEIYTRKVKMKSISVDFGTPIPKEFPLGEVLFQNKRLLYWINGRIAMILSGNYIGSCKISADHRLRIPTKLLFGDQEVIVEQINLLFDQETNWFSQVVTLDASLGMYDYIRGRVQMGSGKTRYVMKGVDIYNGDPIDFIPEKEDLSVGLLPGELHIDLLLVEGLEMPKDPSDTPDISNLVIEEDLDWRIEDSSNAA